MDIRTPGRVGYVLRDSTCTRWPAPLRAYARRPIESMYDAWAAVSRMCGLASSSIVTGNLLDF